MTSEAGGSQRWSAARLISLVTGVVLAVDVVLSLAGVDGAQGFLPGLIPAVLLTVCVVSTAVFVRQR